MSSVAVRVVTILSNLTQNLYLIISRRKGTCCDLVAPVISNKLNGPSCPRCNKQQEVNIEMTERRSNRHDQPVNNPNNTFRGNFRPISCHIPSRNPRRQREESIFAASSTNIVQQTSFTVGMPLWQPLYSNHNYAYGHLPQTLFQPHLNQQYFHRPNRGNQRPVHGSVKNVVKNIIEELRFWEQTSKNNTKSGFSFTVMSYNVLAQELLVQHPKLYSLHGKEFLKWDVRWNNLLAEIQQFQPEILCLQEVQKSHLKPYFSTLQNLGYQELYKQRTGIRTDGCAIYYKHSLLKLVEYTSVEYRQPRITLLDRDNVGLIAKFSPKNYKNEEFIIATTHLLYNPKRQDVRLAQIQLLLTEIDRLAFKPGGQYLPVIVTGDLNSSPDSAVYKFITQGKLKYENLQVRSLKHGDMGPKTGKKFLPAQLRITDQCQHADLLAKRQINASVSRKEELDLIELKNSERKYKENSRQNNRNDERNLFSTGTLSHNFSLKSVYSHGKNGDVEGTTFQDEWLSVDYIFFSQPQGKSQKLSLLERYRLPTKSELGDLKIPNEKLGSDHLSLLAKFHLHV